MRAPKRDGRGRAGHLLYRFEDYALDTDRRELRRANKLISVEPQVFDILEYLIQNRERVVSKDDLIASIWNGRIVSESALSTRINAARSAIGDSGETQRFIRTSPRKGVRFVGEVIAGQRLPDKPSLAVLPFTNLSGDPEQEYFADGIVEDIITGVAKLRWFFVIARNSSFAYKGKTIDLKRVADELGVRYVLEGSVRKGGNRIRIAAQLIDASTGSHMWTDRYDGDLTDVFALQDEITKKVVAAIEPRLLEAEGIRSQDRSPEDIGAWDMAIQANFLFWRLTKTDGEAAIAILTRAIERYPDYAPAHSMLAFMLLVSSYLGWNLMESHAKDAASLASRAAELDDSDPSAHLALGFVAYTRRRTDEAVEEFQRALDLNPNFAAAHGYLGWALAFDGQSDRAITHLQEAIRMSSHDPQNSIFNGGLGAAHYLAGRYTEAIRFARRSLQQRSGFTGVHRLYVACLAQAGQLDEARAALERLRELQPDVSIAWIEKYVPYTPGPMAKFLEGMRKVGLQ